MNTTFYVVYFISQIMLAYIAYQLFGVFFERNKKINWIEAITFLGAYILLGIFALNVHIPVVRLLANLLICYFLTYFYKSTISKKILSVTLTVILLTVAEIITALLFSFQSVANNDIYGLTTFSLIVSKLISYILVLIFKNFKNVKKGIDVPLIYWFALSIIPAGSLYIIVFLTNYNIVSNTRVSFSIMLIFIINVSVFYLYDTLSNSYKSIIENTLLQQQNDYYNKQLKIMDDSHKNVRKIRHDIKNHLIVLGSYIKDEQGLNYIKNIIDSTYTEAEIAKTGNLDIDSLLNYKLQYVKQNNIEFQLKSSIPSDLSLNIFDVTVIFGNLIDNAIEAVLKLEDNRKIFLLMEYKHNTLYIRVENSFNGEIDGQVTALNTTKDDKENHGIGLKNIKEVINKYNGTIDISQNSDNFIVEILIYI